MPFLVLPLVGRRRRRRLDQQREEEFYDIGGRTHARTRTDELQFSRLLAPRRTTRRLALRTLETEEEERRWLAGWPDGITSQVWEAVGSFVHSDSSLSKPFVFEF